MPGPLAPHCRRCGAFLDMREQGSRVTCGSCGSTQLASDLEWR